jgi:5-methylcytosine-specific restriction endonuclease McrA
MGQSTGPKPDRRKGAMFRCVICGGEFYRPQSLIKRGITKTCGKFECKCENAGPKPGPRPYRLNGATFKCVICGKEFYRKRSFIERGITNTCGKSACKSGFFSGSNNPAWGRIPTDDNREAVSQSNKKRTGPPKGYKHTLEARAKMSEAVRMRWRDRRDFMIASLTKPPKPRSEMRYRKDFTPWQRQDWKSSACLWCAATDDLVLDHIIPVVAGGLNIKGNAQTLCQPCNLWKMVYVDHPYYLAKLASEATAKHA